MLLVSLGNASTAVKVEGIDYFFDTLLFAGRFSRSSAKRRMGSIDHKNISSEISTNPQARTHHA